MPRQGQEAASLSSKYARVSRDDVIVGVAEPGAPIFMNKITNFTPAIMAEVTENQFLSYRMGSVLCTVPAAHNHLPETSV